MIFGTSIIKGKLGSENISVAYLSSSDVTRGGQSSSIYYLPNIISETDLSDSNVTLVCGEDRQIKAHTIVKDKWGIAQSRTKFEF